MDTKICSICKKELDLCKFNKKSANNHKDGLRSDCKSCQEEYRKKYYNLNKEILLKKKKEKLEKNKEEINAKRREYIQNNEIARKKANERCKIWSLKNKDKISKYMKKYNKKNKERYKKWKKLHRIKHPEYYENLDYKLRIRLRSRIRMAIKNSKNAKKCYKTMDLIGCTLEFLKEYLEKQFLPGMTWENNTNDGWHIDHIIPCVNFDLTDPEQQKKCFHYTNLRPLWAKDNQSGKYNIFNKKKKHSNNEVLSQV